MPDRHFELSTRVCCCCWQTNGRVMSGNDFVGRGRANLPNNCVMIDERALLPSDARSALIGLNWQEFDTT